MIEYFQEHWFRFLVGSILFGFFMLATTMKGARPLWMSFLYGWIIYIVFGTAYVCLQLWQVQLLRP